MYFEQITERCKLGRHENTIISEHILPYLLYIVRCSHHKTSLDYHMKVDYLMKGYLHFKTIFCNKIAFDV